MTKKIRNIAIIAHIDHGKTTLVDKLLAQTNSLNAHASYDERILDANDLEKERGITILAKTTAIHWRDHTINLVDTPGHADFGGEVERVLSMVDAVLLLVDAVDGPMPQTRFVTEKAFKHKLKPIVVINKIDRDQARPDWVVDQVFDLFDGLGASDEQLDFPYAYCSALAGTATTDLAKPGDDLSALLDMILERCPPPPVTEEAPLQLQISLLDYSSYVGAIGIGRINQGTLKPNQTVTVIDREGKERNGKVLQVLKPEGLERVACEVAHAGDIVAISGIDPLNVSDTLCDPAAPEALPALTVDEPTVSVIFQVNNSPFAGKEGKYITSRKILERLEKELIYNVALRVRQTEDPEKFEVSGRGELHLTILIETMRREGYELAVSRPQVITKMVDGVEHEPYEMLIVDVPTDYQGAIMQNLAERAGQLQDIQTLGTDRVRLEYMIPTRGLIGFHNESLTLSSGTAITNHLFDHYGPSSKKIANQRINGALIANVPGKATAYSLFNLQARGKLFIDPQTEVYEGMIVGLHSRDNDLVVNVIKGKQLTNVRASGTDENIVLTPPPRFSLEQALEWINDDELVEITPESIRFRKKILLETERKRLSRASKEG